MCDRIPPSWLAPAFVLVLATGGCGSTGSADGLPREPAAREKALGDRLALRDPRTGEEGGATYLEVTLSNPSSDRVTARCAPEWYDAKGAVVAAASAWQDVSLKPGEERRLRFAPMPAASRSWRLRFAP
ncbi:MAG: DUF1425 domain-containing protein [Planctomycetota bacterium]|nr:DUF1425 domain-containing protein [Planctomycetota bacterium]